MGGRDHSIPCEHCGVSYGGFDGPDECPCREVASGGGLPASLVVRDCALCSLPYGKDAGASKFAVWLHSRGWLVDTCGSSANVADRLYGATWFSTEEEALQALEAACRDSLGSVQYLSELGEVVTL